MVGKRRTPPVVAIVGRPNVGKSALFNRIVHRRQAIVEAEPGVTRDRVTAATDWEGRPFFLVDTGGIEPDPLDDLRAQVRKQAEQAIAEADAIIFLVDARAGVVPADRDIAERLRRAGVPVVVAANKVDEAVMEPAAAEFWALGLGEPVPVSAIHGLGVAELLETVMAQLPEALREGTPEEPTEAAIRVAIVGRPNVGKSSLFNALLGEERTITSDIPGTTRDAVDVELERDGRRFVLIDTAGLRRKARVDAPVERYSVLRALRAIDRASVALILLDAVEGLTEQDKKIAGYVHEAGRGSVLVWNKWDLVAKDEATAARYAEVCRRELPFMTYAPVITASARTGQRLGRILETVVAVDGEHQKTVRTADLNRVLQEALTLNPPPAEHGRRLKIYYGTQTGTRPPRFTCFCNHPELVHFSYRRYLENRLREAYGFMGTPLWFAFRARR